MDKSRNVIAKANAAADEFRSVIAVTYHSSPGALRKYLKEHPNADKSKHQVSTKYRDRARPKREKEYAKGRAEKDLQRQRKILKDDEAALEGAKDDKEREEIQKDIDAGNKNIEKLESKLKGDSKPKGKPADSGKDDNSDLDLDVRDKLKKLSPAKREDVIQKALLNEKSDDGKPVKQKDVSGDKGFEVLKGLDPAAQKRVIERALRMASNDAADAFRLVLGKMYHPSPQALREYLKDHPRADPRKHEVSNKYKKPERPQRERGYKVERMKSDVGRYEKMLKDDQKALETAKDDKERAEIEHDIKQSEKNIAELKKKLEQAEGERDKHRKEADEAAESFRALVAMEHPSEGSKTKAAKTASEAAEAFRQILANCGGECTGGCGHDHQAVSPPGWEDTVKKMKKHPDEIDNPWALSWYMKNKGYTPGGKEAAVFLVAKANAAAEAFRAALEG